MSRIYNIIIGISLAFVVGSCGESVPEYTMNFKCNFRFNLSTHNTSILTKCVESQYSNMFCMVSLGVENGVKTFVLEPYDEEDKEIVKRRTSEEADAPFILGASNRLIIGYGTLNGGKLMAYDGMCAKCLDVYSYHTLRWTDNGNCVECPSCHSVYELNNNGFCRQGGMLKKYPARIEVGMYQKYLVVAN